MTFELFDKQKEIISSLTDYNTRYLLAGGGAGGSKTITGCYWLMQMGYYAPGTRYFIGRDRIKDTKESVLQSWRKLSEMIGFDDYWSVKDGDIAFFNGSNITFLNLSFQPVRDPDFEGLGSKEFTAGWIEEAGQVKAKAFDVLKSRVGRWKNKEFGIPPKILLTCNPSLDWLFDTFYLPWKNGTEEKQYKFIQALAKDNPHLPPEYMQGLRDIKDKSTRERLLNGNWEADDDPTALLSHDQILGIFNNDHIEQGEGALTADIARFGSDKAVLIAWKGLVIKEVQTFDYSKTTDLEDAVRAMSSRHRIPRRRVVVDEDGVGGGVVDHLNCCGFVNGSKALDPAYNSLKDECGYKLAEMIDDIYLEADLSIDVTKTIRRELGQLKTYAANKLRLLPKEKIKEAIGHSPDYLDNFIMRMFLEINNASNPYAGLSKKRN